MIPLVPLPCMSNGHTRAKLSAFPSGGRALTAHLRGVHKCSSVLQSRRVPLPVSAQARVCVPVRADASRSAPLRAGAPLAPLRAGAPLAPFAAAWGHAGL